MQCPKLILLFQCLSAIVQVGGLSTKNVPYWQRSNTVVKKIGQGGKQDFRAAGLDRCDLYYLKIY